MAIYISIIQDMSHGVCLIGFISLVYVCIYVRACVRLCLCTYVRTRTHIQDGTFKVL